MLILKKRFIRQWQLYVAIYPSDIKSQLGRMYLYLQDQFHLSNWGIKFNRLVPFAFEGQVDWIQQLNSFLNLSVLISLKEKAFYIERIYGHHSLVISD
jgi:hypothetical protein